MLMFNIYLLLGAPLSRSMEVNSAHSMGGVRGSTVRKYSYESSIVIVNENNCLTRPLRCV